MKKVVVLGAGGFIGSHLVTRLKNIPAQDNYVVGVDIKEPEYINDCDQFSILDLTNQHAVDDFFMRNHFDIVYQLAADMGGADYIFTGDNDLDINVLKGKQLTNMRASGTDEAVVLVPPRIMSLEEMMAYINEDELLEVTPLSLRLRKRFLDAKDRKKSTK